MNRRNFLKILAALPFLGRFTNASTPTPIDGKKAFTIKADVAKKQAPTNRIREGERIKLLPTGEVFFVKSVNDSIDSFGNPVNIIKIDKT